MNVFIVNLTKNIYTFFFLLQYEFLLIVHRKTDFYMLIKSRLKSMTALTRSFLILIFDFLYYSCTVMLDSCIHFMITCKYDQYIHSSFVASKVFSIKMTNIRA